MPVSEPSVGASGWNAWGHAITGVVNAVEDAPDRLSTLEAANHMVSVSGDLWVLANARWDATAQEFYRIDKTHAAFGMQLQAVGLIPGEPDLGYYVSGVTTWVAQPEAYDLIRNGGSPANPRFGGVGGWELGTTLTEQRQFTVGGMGIELDGSGTFPYGRVVHSTTVTAIARRLTGMVHNVYPDFGGADDVARPSWFWGWTEQYDTGTGATVAGSRKWQVSFIPAGTTTWTPRLTIDEFGTVSSDNLHADSLLAVGYPDTGGGITVLGIQNANTVPTTNPSNGVVVYAQGGELRCRNSSGVITTLSGELVHAVGNAGSTLTLDASSVSGSVKTLTLNANCTFTLSGATSGRVATLELYLTQDGTGSRTVTWPASVKWDNAAAPTLSTAAGATDCVLLRSVNGGTTWLGNLAGKGYA